MRQPDPPTPEQVRELDALDRALAGQPVDPDLRELEQLLCDVRATAPPMSPAFAARLEHEVDEGFPTPVQRPRLRRPRRWVLLPAAGVLASALIALVVVLGQSGQPDTTDQVAGGGARDERTAGENVIADSAARDLDGAGSAKSPAPNAVQSAPLPSSAPSVAADSAPSAPALERRSAQVTRAGAKRKVESNAVLVLEAPDGEVESTADAVIRTVDRFDGIVESSSIGSSDSTGGEASFNLRIPTDKLDEALAALSKLGHVAERNQSLQDITGSFHSLQDRLSDARAERRGLLRALGRATTQPQIASLRARLRIVRGTIGRLNGDLAALRNRADLSTVQVTVRGSDKAGGGSADPWTPGDAANDALRVLEVIAGVALIALAVAVPLALLGVLIALGARIGRRRGRERALDPA